ncbi:bifunctional (p)ppGpp synthetase/guanosine-3',5'-bis(diphosphate) 3'-pyrophosphohydrolase [Clostridia bacterium]|nr:bifunctional (p)ppGpp synthetase/guanosine-3',5'-bis(diphosphate) 3'-pyrophosphohydrolase [Clostridia bacterium]
MGETLNRKFSPSEKKAMQFAELKHEGQKRIGGADYINHPIQVAEYLYDHGYRGKYVFTAFCHDLLEDTNATEEEIFDLCGRFTRDAVKLLSKLENQETEQYLSEIKKNEVAYVVKVADRIQNLLDSEFADLEFREKYVKETEEYYLEFAKDSPFYRDLVRVLKCIKIQNMKEKNMVMIHSVELFHMHEDFYVLLGYVLEEEPILLSCLIHEDSAKCIGDAERIPLELYAIPKSDVKLYRDERAYFEDSDNIFHHESIAAGLKSIEINDEVLPAPESFLTGVVEGVIDSEMLGDAFDENTYLVYVHLLGMTVLVEVSKNDIIEPAVGNILSGIFDMYARV